MNRRSFLAPLLSAVMLVAPALLTTAPAVAQTPTTGLVTGIVQSIPGGTFVGTLTVTGFNVVNGVLNAVGTISGTLTRGGTATAITNQAVTIPITGITGTCGILSLQTGTIDLNVLGLNVHLAPINLEITAQSGPGQLLGNLLCAVVHLLDQGGPLSNLLGSLSGLLNQILGQIPIL